MRPFLPPLLLCLAIFAASPFMGLVRDALLATFPGQAVRGLAFLLAAVAVLLVAVAVARIRERRPLRYAGLGVVALLLWLQGVGWSTGIAQVDLVEKIHIVQFGGLAFLLYHAVAKCGRDLRLLLVPLLGTALAGALDESVQGFFQARTGDIRDVALNALAGVCGLIFALSLTPPERLEWRADAGARRALGLLAATSLLAIGLFYGLAHLGYDIDDPELGRFRSWHTADELRAAAEERRRRWAVDPPTELVAWHAEDYFLTEAAWHANHRNERYRSGDLYMAAQANRILKKYYDPFLDLESFRGSGRHRYSEDVERQLDQAAPPDPGRYVSPVLRQRIRTWPPQAPFLALVATLAALIAGWSLRQRPRPP